MDSCKRIIGSGVGVLDKTVAGKNCTARPFLRMLLCGDVKAVQTESVFSISHLADGFNRLNLILEGRINDA